MKGEGSVQGEPEQRNDGGDDGRDGPDYRAEFDAVEQLLGSGLDAAWLNGAGAAPLLMAGPSDVATVQAAYEVAGSLAGQLQWRLVFSGLNAGDMPRVRPDVDEEGNPVVTVAKLNATAVDLPMRSLPGGPIRPAARGSSPAA